MRTVLILVLMICCSSLQAQKKVYYHKTLKYAHKKGCHYALVYKSDSNKRLDFYDCKNQLLKSQSFSKKFNPKKDFTNDFLEGEEIVYHPNGAIASRCHYKDGYKEGMEMLYTKGGLPIGRALWKNGKKFQGAFSKVFLNGYIKLDIYKNYRTLETVMLDSLGDTSSIYIYNRRDSIKLLDKCIVFTAGKRDSVHRFKPDYRNTFSKNKDTTPTVKKYKSVEDSLLNHMVVFIGGQDGFSEFLSDELTYPSECQNQGIEGVVMVCFIVGREGNIIDILGMGEAHSSLRKNAVNTLFASDGMWASGRINGAAQICYCRIPITFELDE